MSTTEPTATRLADYAPPPFLVDEVVLDFELDEERTVVRAKLRIRRNPDAPPEADLVLDGEGLETRAVRIDAVAVSGNRIEIAQETLTIRDAPDAFVLDTEVAVRPGANKSLEGLYASSGNLCTQCEAEGFRKITWSLDRPDVMARYRVRIVGDPRRYPVMLSNGNDVARGALDDGRRYVVWEDPFPKPSYLFALVAG
ncbi:MAG: aminopeptidase N, partial [Chromatiales bacterium]|nr:aminopeptidase N [Chromatiales bacterium]